MKKALFNLTSLLGVLVLLTAYPMLAMAERTSAPVLTGLFPSSTLSLNLPAPTNFSLGQATTTGTVYSNGGNALYFAVVALDGTGGTSVIGTLLGTSTVNEAHGYQLTWNTIPGAYGYRVYFSTSTPQAMVQYFTATSTASTTNNYYTFTSTSSPTFNATIPTANTAYVNNFTSNGNSWLNGGSFAIGTTTFPTNVMFSVATTTATTTILYGAKGISGGRIIIVDTSGAHTTCTELSTAGGAGTFKAVTCP